MLENSLPRGTLPRCSQAPSGAFAWIRERVGHPRRSRSMYFSSSLHPCTVLGRVLPTYQCHAPASESVISANSHGKAMPLHLSDGLCYPCYRLR